MNNPLISILIPCFNGEKYIDQCLTSVIQQTYQNLEILIINDGSTDDSLKILKAWEKKDPRIKVSTQMNLGLSLSRNYLIDISRGTYFSLLDVDDTLPAKSIENLYKNSYEGKADIVVGRTSGVYNNGQIKIPYIPVWRRKKNMSNLDYVKSNICTPWSSIMKKSFFVQLDCFFLPKRVFEDIGIMPYIYLKAEIFVAINEITYNYHKYSNDANKISNFKEKSFLKRNDLLIQSINLFNNFQMEGWEKKREFKKAINGVFFEILVLNNILLNNFTVDQKIKRLLKYNVYKMLNSFGWKLKFTKTPWKAMAYFYLRLSYIKFFKNNIIFKKPFQANYIPIKETEENIKIYNKKLKIFEFNKEVMNKKNLKNLIVEIQDTDFIKNHQIINESKLKYIFIRCENDDFKDFIPLLNYQNIYGLTIKSEALDPRIFRDNENFLIINIEYIHHDEFSLKKLINQLTQFNYMLRRPLIFVKCKWNIHIVRMIKGLVDYFIFVNKFPVIAKTINDKQLITRKTKL